MSFPALTTPKPVEVFLDRLYILVSQWRIIVSGEPVVSLPHSQSFHGFFVTKISWRGNVTELLPICPTVKVISGFHSHICTMSRLATSTKWWLPIKCVGHVTWCIAAWTVSLGTRWAMWSSSWILPSVPIITMVFSVTFVLKMAAWSVIVRCFRLPLSSSKVPSEKGCDMFAVKRNTICSISHDGLYMFYFSYISVFRWVYWNNSHMFANTNLVVLGQSWSNHGKCRYDPSVTNITINNSAKLFA